MRHPEERSPVKQDVAQRAAAERREAAADVTPTESISLRAASMTPDSADAAVAATSMMVCAVERVCETMGFML